MSILQGTIFEGNTRVFLDASNTDLLVPFHVTEGAFLVDDGEGGWEEFLVNNSFFELGPGKISEFESVTDHIQQYEALNKQLSANTFRPPGKGPITALFELDDVVYAARTLSNNSGAQIYKTTELFDLASNVSWIPIDMGFELEFEDGRTRPITLSEREFLDVVPEDAPPLSGVRASSGQSIATSRSLEGGALALGNSDGTGRWTDIDNLFTNDSEAVAFTRRRPQQGTIGEHFTETLQLTGFVSLDEIPTNAQITGVSVDIDFSQSVFTVQTDTPYGLLSRVRLLNVGASDNKGSVAVGDRITLTAVGTPVNNGRSFVSGALSQSFGDSTDTWGLDALDTSSVINPQFGVEIEMGAFIGETDTGVQDRRDFFINDVRITVHFDNGTERVYFWDGTDDVAEGDLVALQRTEGSWNINNAKGWFTLYDVVNDDASIEGLEIRTAPDGEGSLIAIAKSDMSRNLLPTWEEMKETNALAQYIKANFFIDSEKEALYGVTGAGPAFAYDGRHFRFIHAPIPLEKDKPRHVIEHESHLILAYPSGSILVSVVGQPENFNGLEGAAEFGFGDTITDLIPLSGSAVGILCQRSTHALIGNTIENFTTQVISKTSGALEYSAAVVGQPIFTDFRGVTTIENTSAFGDFIAGRLSQKVTPLIQGRVQDFSGISINLQDLICAIPVRNRNQYRLFFNDGYILTMTMFGMADEMPVFTVQKYDAQKETLTNPNSRYVPTAILSTVLSRGAELIMMGTASGDIYVLNTGTGILTGSGIKDYYATITFNPFNGGEPHSNLKFNEIIIHGQTSGGQELVTSAGVNYLVPDPLTETDEITMGNLNNGFSISRVPQKKSTHLPNVTSGFSLKIESQADGNIPHIIQALTFRPVPLGDQSVGQKRYAGIGDSDI